jgi:hypothetical protein
VSTVSREGYHCLTLCVCEREREREEEMGFWENGGALCIDKDKEIVS